MAKSVRPLTIAERKSPASSVFVGGFKNVSFQVGKVETVTGQDSEQSIPSLLSATLVKSDTVRYPIKVPTSVRVLNHSSNVVCNVVGQPNHHGDYDAFLLVRNIERLSSFSVALRNIKDVVESGLIVNDEPDRIGKGRAARAHNQVFLTGVVVGASFEDGENPRLHIKLRQTSDPTNIIPLIYQAKNASGLVGRVKVGGLITVSGEYAIRKLPVYQTENGRVVHDENNRPVVQLNENGEPLTRLNSYVRILAPLDIDPQFDTNFVRPDGTADIPKWVRDLADEATARSKRTAGRDPEEVVVPAEALVPQSVQSASVTAGL